MLTPDVARLNRLDTYRDGGSLSLSFSNKADQEFTLFFKIDRRTYQLPDNQKVYKHALLKAFTNKTYASPVTHDTMTLPEGGNTEQISWEDALAILDEALRLESDFESDYKWVFPEMIEVAKRSGKSQA